MADTPIAPVSVTELPEAPNRNLQTDPLTYSQRADAWAAALPDWTDEANLLAVNVNFNAESAFDSAAVATVSAQSALASQTAAVAAANFLGEWSALTGPLAPPASVRHEGRVWSLLVSVADVTASEPGVSSDWSIVSQFYRSTRTSNTIISINDFGQIIDITSGTFTQTFLSASELGFGFYCYLINSGSGVVTLDPDGSETINITSVYSGDITMILSDGSNLYAYLLNKDRSVNEIILARGNGYGAVNTRIRRFLTVEKNAGTAMTYADSADDGASITINMPGVYAISYFDAGNGNYARVGVSVNSNQLTTGIDEINAANRIMYFVVPEPIDIFPANSPLCGSVTLNLSAGDVVRPHNAINMPDSNVPAATKFSIVKVA